MAVLLKIEADRASRTHTWLELFQSITNLSKQILDKYFNESEQNYEKKVPTFHIEFIISIFPAKKFINMKIDENQKMNIEYELQSWLGRRREVIFIKSLW